MNAIKIVFLPFNLFHQGHIFGGIVVLFFWILFVYVLCAAIYQVVNYIGVKSQIGEAAVMAKRTVPAHWEWQSRGRFMSRVYVDEYQILDVKINGKKISYRPIPWILEKTMADTVEPVEFVAGRLNGKIVIKKFKYL